MRREHARPYVKAAFRDLRVDQNAGRRLLGDLTHEDVGTPNRRRQPRAIF
jgi:hypothetical protein